jgi:hypothetical protein
LRSLLAALEVIGAIPVCVARRALAAMAVAKTAESITVALSAAKFHWVATCGDLSRRRSRS